MFFSQTLDLVALNFPEVSQADKYLRFQRVVHLFSEEFLRQEGPENVWE